MKKLFYATIMTFVMIGMNACTGNADVKGTTWLLKENGTMMDGSKAEVESTITFTTATEGVLIVTVNNHSGETPFKYTYDKSGKGTLTSTDDDGSELISNFTVEDKELVVVEGNERYVYHKQ